MKKVLVTGGLGYIGSHSVLKLLNAGFEVIVIDNLSNSQETVVTTLGRLSNRCVQFFKCDLRDSELLNEILQNHTPDLVMHFAALKAVGESVNHPSLYYENNVIGSMNLVSAMLKNGCNKIVFSSSATVYGKPEYLPLNESHPLRPTNPYGRTKMLIEQYLEDVCVSDPTFSAICLRYFNPIGAHASGKLGEQPNGIPNNIMPVIMEVLKTKIQKLEVYGNDYKTRDGTGERDYIHVEDLASAHLDATIFSLGVSGYRIFNLGTGNGVTVEELITCVENISGLEVKKQYCERRLGDVASVYTDNSYAKRLLNWEPRNNLESMVRSHLRFSGIKTR